MKKLLVCMVLVALFGSYNTNVKAVDGTESEVAPCIFIAEPPRITETEPANRVIIALVGQSFTFKVSFETEYEVDIEIKFTRDDGYEEIMETLTVDGQVVGRVEYTGTWFNATSGRIDVKIKVNGAIDYVVESFALIVMEPANPPQL